MPLWVKVQVSAEHQGHRASFLILQGCYWHSDAVDKYSDRIMLNPKFICIVHKKTHCLESSFQEQNGLPVNDRKENELKQLISIKLVGCIYKSMVHGLEPIRPQSCSVQLCAQRGIDLD